LTNLLTSQCNGNKFRAISPVVVASGGHLKSTRSVCVQRRTLQPLVVSKTEVEKPMIGTIARVPLRNSLLCFAMLLCALPSLVWAQATPTGTVTGIVTDPSNAVIAGATVSLIDPTTKSSRDTK